MRLLITGVDGFVGSHAAEHFLAHPGGEAHGTFLPGRSPGHSGSIPGLVLHAVDLLDGVGMSRLLRELRPDAVLHLAAQAFVPASVADPTGTFQTNVMGGINLLEAVREMRDLTGHSPLLLLVSTGEVYGRVPESAQPITEAAPLQPNNPYASSKAAIDLIAQQYRRSYGLAVTIARPFNHIGPRQSPVFVASDFARQVAQIAAGLREPVMNVGNIEARRDFTDVRDVVRAYTMLLDRPPEEAVVNVCSGTATPVGWILETLQRIAGVTVEVRTDAARLRAYDVPSVVGSRRVLEHVTGWKPAIPLETTLRDTYAYWAATIRTEPAR
jgi:GDP-4-dehydro-6-deoxy-D-mannose reductase